MEINKQPSFDKNDEQSKNNNNEVQIEYIIQQQVLNFLKNSSKYLSQH